MPRLPKPQHLRQNRERRDFGVVPVPATGAVIIPLPPRGLLRATRLSWETFWRSTLAQQTARLETDRVSVERLWGLYDERDRAMRAAKKARVVMGSKGQPVLHPLLDYVGRLDPEIRQLEDRFGLNPMARLKLGITYGDAARSLADINADLEDDDDDRDAPAADLRASLAAPADLVQPAAQSPAADTRRHGDSVDGGQPGARAGRRRRPAAAAP